MAKTSVNEASIITALEDLFKKAPHLPANIRVILVNVAPWFVLVFGVLGIIGGLQMLVNPSQSAKVYGGYEILWMISAVLSVIYAVFLLMAFPKLRKHQYSGWRFLFWADIIGVASSLVIGWVLHSVIMAVIIFYLLFEIKSYYK